MKPKDVHKFVMRYLEATDCHISDKSPARVTARLSPEADKDLTNRTYYWSFVERTGAEPQTMTMTFVFEPESEQSTSTPANSTQEAAGGDSILGRYFGFAPAPPNVGRIPFEEMTYGSRRLTQLFGVVRTKGRFVQMFEEIKHPRGAPAVECQAWLCVNYKLEFCCDMKRDELHSLGISLATGEIIEDFHEHLSTLPLTPRLPANTLLQRPVWSIQRAIVALEQFLEREIRHYSHDWAKAAHERLTDELSRVNEYYGELLRTIEEDNRSEVEAQYAARKQEIEWQYRPRIEANVVNAGVFHLSVDSKFLR